jgi:hypothetical protein
LTGLSDAPSSISYAISRSVYALAFTCISHCYRFSRTTHQRGYYGGMF